MTKDKDKKDKKKEKSYYDVKVECTLPALLLFRVYAQDEEDAAQLVKHLKPNSVSYDLTKRKDLKLTIYDAGCSIIKFLLRF